MLDVQPLRVEPLRPGKLPEPGPLVSGLNIAPLRVQNLEAPPLNVSPLSVRLMQLAGLGE